MADRSSATKSARRDINRTSGKPSKVKLRCAVYTRKSSDEGLEQSFNSLHAQRDACEAYVASQKHEGWMLLSQAYDDGGLSGGSMERPALQRLLEDIRSGLIDIVVVYKVDRLTRSLADFAKLTELFDLQGTSFVSVTQHFNTSTSMGRLTLNVLLSFAQFEREVAGERIRDKIALSKRRGMWMGGLPPLGYDGIDKKLIINEQEAATVRYIYEQYLKISSIAELKQDLDREGIASKRRQFVNGKSMGGVPMSRGAIYQILRNRLYRGEIAHRGEIHAGNHDAIIDAALWDKVQEKLAGQSAKPRRSLQAARHPETDISARTEALRRSAHLLAGLVFDGDGNRLTPSHSNKSGRRYLYYVSAPLVRGRSAKSGIRVPAADLERLVVTSIAERFEDELWLIDTLGSDLDATDAERAIAAGKQLGTHLRAHIDIGEEAVPRYDAQHLSVRNLLGQIVVEKNHVTVTLDSGAIASGLAELDPVMAGIVTDTEPVQFTVPAHTLRCGKQVRLVVGQVDAEAYQVDPCLVTIIADSYRWFEQLKSGSRSSIADIARLEGREVSDVSRSITLAFLAPEIVEMILTGQQPVTLTAEKLRTCRPIVADWNVQKEHLFG